MIAHFSVENFYSIKDKQSINFFSNIHGAESEDSLMPGRNIIENEPAILPVIGIFGANASGKTNLLNALNMFVNLYTSGSTENFPHKKKSMEKSLFISPFLLDKKSSSLPTKFEILIALNNIFYEYTIHVLKDVIQLEKLEIIENEKPILIFSRTKQSNDKIVWDINSKGIKDKSLYENILGATGHLKESKLFMSYLAETFDWNLITHFDRFINMTSVPYFHDKSIPAVLHDYTMEKLKNKEHREIVSSFLSLFDAGIVGLEFKNDILFSKHLSEDGEGDLLNFSFESQGVKQLLTLSTLILSSLAFGKMVLIDEIDAHLHPHISIMLLKIFQSKQSNPHNAQLIFTSHDMQLMDSELMRREQIYISNRGNLGASTYICLGDIKGLRKDKRLNKAYLEGYFSGVPILHNEDRFLYNVMKFAESYRNGIF